MGGGTILYHQADRNCHAIDNCGIGSRSATCAVTAGRNIPNEPNVVIPSTYLGTPMENFNTRNGAAQPYHAQGMHLTVTAVAVDADDVAKLASEGIGGRCERPPRRAAICRLSGPTSRLREVKTVKLKAVIAFSITICAAGLSSRNASAEVTFANVDGWELYTAGRVRVFLSTAFGDSNPVPPAASGKASWRASSRAAVCRSTRTACRPPRASRPSS